MNLLNCPGKRIAPRTVRLIVLLSSAAALMAACAGVPAPTGQMAVSTAALANAVSAGGSALAPGEMRIARDKLERANAALAAEDYTLARTLAEQSEVDSQLAIAKSRSATAAKAAGALQEDSRVLREEINRKAQP